MLDQSARSAVQISVDNLLEGVQVIAFDWTYLYLNAAAAEHGSRMPAELIGRTMMAAYPGIEQTPMFTALQRVMTTRQCERLMTSFVGPEGDTRWFELSIDPVPDGICVLSVDVTDRYAAEQQLRHAQKVEILGELSGGITHDFNNILTVILGYAELITSQIGPDKPIGRDMREIVAAAERAAALTRQLLTFSRKQPAQPGLLSVNRVIDGLLPMLRRLIRENVTIRTSLAPDAHGVLADASQLEQAIVNLVVNARDAMRDGGVITIRTTNAAVGRGRAPSGLQLDPGPYVVIGVEDTGSGMTPEVRARIFDAFFTTKDAGRGTGLGLTVVHGAITQLGGDIDVTSAPGHGSTFSIYLPASDLPVGAVASEAYVGSPLGVETVLVVEDDPNVRVFTRTVLERHGFQVLEAATGEQALAILEEGAAPIDLLLADVVLPGIDGSRLAAHVASDHAAVRVLLMSGYSEAMGRVASTHHANVMEKPFTPHTLLSRVRDALGSPAPATR